MTTSLHPYDVAVIGAGAAGLMAAIEAGKRGRRVVVIEHSNKVGEKIRISGGGRCNFTNTDISSRNYLSQNPHFSKSALSQFTNQDFIDLVTQHGIHYHEKTLGQLFCDGSSAQIIDMLIGLCTQHHVVIHKNIEVKQVTHDGSHFSLEAEGRLYQASALIVACGGLSIPKIGASDFGYRIARQFGCKIVETRPALVPLVLQHPFTILSGVSLPIRASVGKISFREAMLFTHKGLSGPAILQISSYLPAFKNISLTLDLYPDGDFFEALWAHKTSKQTLATVLKLFFPNRFVDYLLDQEPDTARPLVDLPKSLLVSIAHRVHTFTTDLNGTEGYQKAEVTSGGVSTSCLSSKTMACTHFPSLYFVGEVVDVTGWLGGYNFQWAWSSGAVAGQHA